LQLKRTVSGFITEFMASFSSCAERSSAMERWVASRGFAERMVESRYSEDGGRVLSGGGLSGCSEGGGGEEVNQGLAVRRPFGSGVSGRPRWT